MQKVNAGPKSFGLVSRKEGGVSSRRVNADRVSQRRAFDDVNVSDTSSFDAIRRVNENNHEYWSARDLGKILGYETSYRNFQKALRKAEEACQQSGYTVSDHFAHVRKMVSLGSKAKRSIEDIHLSR